MASLTKDIGSITGGKPIIAPGPQGPSLLSGLAQVGSALTGTLGQYQAMQDRKDQQARQDILFQEHEADRAREDQQRGALNELAAGTISALATQPSVPADIQQSASEVKQVQSGVNQGQVPAATADLKIEKLVQDVAAKYPDQASNIYSWLGAQGLDHVVFRQARNQLAEQDYEEQSRQLQAKEAYTNGFTGSFGDAVQYGARLQQAQAMYDLTKKNVELQTAQQNLSDAQIKAAKTQLGDAAYQNWSTKLGLQLGNIQSSLDQAFLAAGNDPQKQLDLAGLGGTINTTIGEYRRAVLQGLAKDGVDQPTTDRVMGLFDSYSKSITDLYTGPLSQVQSSSRSLDIMKNSWQIETTQAMPLLSKMYGIFGKDATNAMIGGYALNDQTIKALQQEVQSFNPATDSGTKTVLDLGQILTGQKPIVQENDPQKAAQALKSANAIVKGVAPQAASGDPQAVKSWSDSYMVGITSAIHGISPATASRDEIVNAADMLFSPQSRAIINSVVTNPSTSLQGQEMLHASQVAAQQIILSARDKPEITHSGYQMLQQGPDGHYSVVFDNSRFNKDYAQGVFNTTTSVGAMGGVIGGSGYQTTTKPNKDELKARLNRLDPALVKTANALNAATDHLVESRDKDPTLPGSMSVVEARKWYTTQTLPQGLAEKPGTMTPAQVKQTWSNQLQSIRAALSNFTTGLATDPDTEAAGAVTGPQEASSAVNSIWGRLIKQESGGNQSAVSPKGAVGVAQIMPGTGPEAAKLAGLPWDAERLKTDSAYNQSLGQAYLQAQVEKYNGNIAQALAAYNAGPGAVDKAIQKAQTAGHSEWLMYLPKETQGYVHSILGNG